MVSTSQGHVKHLFAGQNTQQILLKYLKSTERYLLFQIPQVYFVASLDYKSNLTYKFLLYNSSDKHTLQVKYTVDCWTIKKCKVLQ